MNPWGFLAGYFSQIVEFQVSEKLQKKERKERWEGGREEGRKGDSQCLRIGI